MPSQPKVGARSAFASAWLPGVAATSIAASPAEGYFGHFTITPHRSFSGAAMRRLLFFGAIAGTLFDLALWLLFGWIVGVITLFDIAFLGLALALHQSGGAAVEDVIVASNGIFVRRLSSRGSLRFAGHLPLRPLEVRRYDDGDYGCRSIELVGASQRFVVGAALQPDERTAFHAALVDALKAAGAMPRLRTDRAQELKAYYLGQ